MTPAEMVREFHEALGLTVRSEPVACPPEFGLRQSLLREEVREWLEARAAGGRVGVAGELADVEYVTHGAAWTHGLDPLEPCLGLGLVQAMQAYCVAGSVTEVRDALSGVLGAVRREAALAGIALDAVIAEVHVANMRKLGADGKPILRADGKVTKPEGWVGPDVARVLGVSA